MARRGKEDIYLGFGEAARALGMSGPSLHLWVKKDKIRHAVNEAGEPLLGFSGQAGRPSRQFAWAEIVRAAREHGRSAQVARYEAEVLHAGETRAGRRRA